MPANLAAHRAQISAGQSKQSSIPSANTAFGCSGSAEAMQEMYFSLLFMFGFLCLMFVSQGCCGGGLTEVSKTACGLVLKH